MRYCMFAKKALYPLLCASLLGMGACGDEKSSDSNPVAPEGNSSSSIFVDPTLLLSSGVDPTPTPTPTSSNTPVVVPSGNYAALATNINAVRPDELYVGWLGAHVSTYEADAATYPTLSHDFTEVFKADYLPASRVVWQSQTTGGYKNQCSEDDATVSLMKARACTVSEGIGYGMLLSYFANDADTFFKLWNYNRAFRHYNGTTNLMPWIIESFSYNVVDAASATDADLDIATALILMYYKTGLEAYKTDALTIINDLWKEEINPANNLILSGNTSMWNGKSGQIVYNLSYFSPVALRLFAKIDTAHDWNAVLDAMYTYMAKVQAGGTGVFPDWSDEAGSAIKAPNGSANTTYFRFDKESVRIPWRIAWDYYWFQDTRAAAILNKLNEVIVEKSTGSVTSTALGTAYSWDLNLGKDKTANTVSGMWLGAWCATGIAGNSKWLNDCTAELNGKTLFNTSTSYFTDILLVMYSQLLNGKFVKPF